MPDEEKGFSVKDRRLFSGEEREKPDQRVPSADKASAETPEKKATSENRASAPKPPQPSQSEAAAGAYADAVEDMPLPTVNFPTFILSLNASALLHLGALEDPETGRPSKNLSMAKQTIDILSMLEEKTRGNLTKDEENMLKNILYDLRIAYVREKS